LLFSLYVACDKSIAPGRDRVTVHTLAIVFHDDVDAAPALPRNELWTQNTCTARQDVSGQGTTSCLENPIKGNYLMIIAKALHTCSCVCMFGGGGGGGGNGFFALKKVFKFKTLKFCFSL